MNPLRRWSSLLAGLCAGAFASPLWQDPPAVPPPAPAATPQQPANAPATQTAPAGLGAPVRHAIEGVYALRRRVIAGKAEPLPCSGYLAITNRHLFLCVAEPGPHPERPLLRAGVRSWQQDRELVRTKVLNGWLTDADGGIVVERPDHEERRKIELVQGGVKVKQDEYNWLEFERIE